MRWKWMALALVASCSAKQVPPVRHEPDPVPEPFRPDWAAAIALQIDEIRTCLRDRPTPVAVIHLAAVVDRDGVGVTGVTAVDGRGYIEDCAISEGRVRTREPSGLVPSDLVGSPLFAPAPDFPSVAPGVVIEEVARDEVVLGWLYWPTSTSSSAEDKE